MFLEAIGGLLAGLVVGYVLGARRTARQRREAAALALRDIGRRLDDIERRRGWRSDLPIRPTEEDVRGDLRQLREEVRASADVLGRMR